MYRLKRNGTEGQTLGRGDGVGETTIAKISAKTLRNMEHPPKHNNEPCEVCGKHNSVVVLHHVVPLEKIVDLINWGHIGLTERRRTVWLCPTCHAYVHLAMRIFNKEKTWTNFRERLERETCPSIAFNIIQLVHESLNEYTDYIVKSCKK